MAERSIYARTLIRAAEIVGGPYALAVAIRVPTEILESWFFGEAIPPAEYFLRAVEIVVADGLPLPVPASPARLGDQPTDPSGPEGTAS